MPGTRKTAPVAMSVTLTTLMALLGTPMVEATLSAMLASTAVFAASAPALSTEPSDGTKEKEKTSNASLTGVMLGVGEVVLQVLEHHILRF